KLLGRWPHFLSVRCSGFLRRGLLRIHSIRTVKTGPVSGHVVSHRLIDVGVMDNVRIHTSHTGVVLEGVSAPSSAPMAVSGIAVTVVDASIKTYGWSPIALVKCVCAVVPAPPRRRPKQTH